jgi:hypothetical protein
MRGPGDVTRDRERDWYLVVVRFTVGFTYLHSRFIQRSSERTARRPEQSRVGTMLTPPETARLAARRLTRLSTPATPSGPLTLTHPTYTVLYPIYVDRSRSHSSPCRSPTATRTSIAVPHSQLQIGVYFEASKPPSTLLHTSVLSPSLTHSLTDITYPNTYPCNRTQQSLAAFSLRCRATVTVGRVLPPASITSISVTCPSISINLRQSPSISINLGHVPVRRRRDGPLTP